jgi:hypothetical protein
MQMVERLASYVFQPVLLVRLSRSPVAMLLIHPLLHIKFSSQQHKKENPMKHNFKTILSGLGGVNLRSQEGDLTLREVSLTALLMPHNGENPTADQKLKRHKLAMTIHSDDVVNVTAEDVAMLKDLINRAYPSPLVVGSAYAILEGEQDAN